MLGVVTASLFLWCQLQLWETLGFAAVGGGFWLVPVLHLRKVVQVSGLFSKKTQGCVGWGGEIGCLQGFLPEAGTQFPLLLCLCYGSLWVHLSPSLGSFHGQICSALLTAVFLLVLLLEP